jgi:hypothetical protein
MLQKRLFGHEVAPFDADRKNTAATTPDSDKMTQSMFSTIWHAIMTKVCSQLARHQKKGLERV